MEIFAYGMDPVLDYLSVRLRGILINSHIVQGPKSQFHHLLSTRPAPPQLSLVSLLYLHNPPTDYKPIEPILLSP